MISSMIPRTILTQAILQVTLITSFLSPSFATPPASKPPEGLRENTPQCFSLRGVKIFINPTRILENASIVVRDGVIESVGQDITIPADAQNLQLAGKTVYAGFIDAFSEVTLDQTTLDTSAAHWNNEITPQLSVTHDIPSDTDKNAQLRQQGITLQLVAPAAGIIKGRSALFFTGNEPHSSRVLKDEVAQHMRLTISRSHNRTAYPNSPMGAVALARQTMLDADWYRRAWAAAKADRSLPRPERNDALNALKNLSTSGQTVITDASNELFFLRADRFAREFSLNLIVRGSGKEYQRLEEIRTTRRPIIVPVDFPKPPNVATPEAATQVTLEALMHWDIAPENPRRLDEAGVRIAFTSYGLQNVNLFLKSIRKAVNRGLKPEAALRALTTTPAALFGVADKIGTVEADKIANFVVTDGNIFDPSTNIVETWVGGQRFELKKSSVVDFSGHWTVHFENRTIDLSVTTETATMSGEFTLPNSDPENPTQIQLNRLHARDTRLSAVFDASLFEHSGFAQLTAVATTNNDGDNELTGYLVWPDGQRTSLSAVRREAPTTVTSAADQVPQKETVPTKGQTSASFDVNYPLGAFGVLETERTPQTILFQNATLWTCGKKEILKDASLLISAGRIMRIGHHLKAPGDALIIDCTGKHITPGLIDCHSHMATDGGINESAQAITAEVRIGDFIDCDDIAIYRQLAGGVTTANVLHGSANPIGGQNQVIKLRWGMLDEDLKFSRAPAGIKFALGENVKQSNWGDEYTTRYPQTRMGVEQIIRDEFHAAENYKQRWKTWQRIAKGIPPRRDLELEAITEILAGERWIHCHSYRQDEILALLRTLDDFNVTIGTFQHILEGYKVAEAMARHGAMGSAFSDWWAYKFEVFDAIPYAGALMHQAGIVVSFNSDDRELARHLNQEAAKATKYGGVPPQAALKFVTLNPAKQLRIDSYVGSLEPGKDADIAIWSGPPMSNFSRCEQTWIEGRKFFDMEGDLKHRKLAAEMRAKLIQKIWASGEVMLTPSELSANQEDLWPREDTFCSHGSDHTHHRP